MLQCGFDPFELLLATGLSVGQYSMLITNSLEAIQAYASRVLGLNFLRDRLDGTCS